MAALALDHDEARRGELGEVRARRRARHARRAGEVGRRQRAAAEHRQEHPPAGRVADRRGDCSRCPLRHPCVAIVARGRFGRSHEPSRCLASWSMSETTIDAGPRGPAPAVGRPPRLGAEAPALGRRARHRGPVGVRVRRHPRRGRGDLAPARCRSGRLLVASVVLGIARRRAPRGAPAARRRAAPRALQPALVRRLQRASSTRPSSVSTPARPRCSSTSGPIIIARARRRAAAARASRARCSRAARSRSPAPSSSALATSGAASTRVGRGPVPRRGGRLRRRRRRAEAAARAHVGAADHVPGLRDRDRRVPAVRAGPRRTTRAARARRRSSGSSTSARSRPRSGSRRGPSR